MFTTRPELVGTFGMVASTHWTATAVGMGILERGGNAFDAAAAAGFALQVVEPHMNGPAGDMPLILHHAERGETVVVCGQGVAPAAATPQVFRDLGLDLVPGTGLLAPCVPGSFDGWMLMLRERGRLPLSDVMAPAIGLAETGYPIAPHVHEVIATVAEFFQEHWPTSAAVYLPGGTVPKQGHLHRNPQLAETYKRIVAEAVAAGGDRAKQIEAARQAWYQGFVADAIDRFCRETEAMDITGRAHKGLLTGDDMARWSAHEEPPLRLDYHGYTLCKAGPWSQGPSFLQQLALLKGYDIADLDPFGAEFVHLVTECQKLAMADREAHYGDPDFVDVPVEDLLSEEYNAERRKLIGDTASMELRPGAPSGVPADISHLAARPPHPLGPLAGFGGGEPTTQTLGPGDTCHLDVADRWGNMVSATPSGGWLQSSPVIPELGFCLGTRAQMFWLTEGLPASLEPGKRPRTTLSPAFAFRDGEPYMAFGTPGGDQQDQWQTGFFLRHVHHGMNLQEAIDAPAFHTDHAPSSFYPRGERPGSLTIEGRFTPAIQDNLRNRGHDLTVSDDWSEGRLSAITRADEDGVAVLRAGANPRRMQGYAAGR